MTAVATTRHTEATREAILEAAVDLFMERQSDGFSVQEVADRAGLTHRTVYRYFPTRQDLLGATAERLAPALVDQRFAEVSTVEEWIDALRAHFDNTEANIELVRGVVAARFTSEDQRLFGQNLRERDSHRWHVFRRQFPDLPEGDARRTFATLRHLMSSTSYVPLPPALRVVPGRGDRGDPERSLTDRVASRPERPRGTTGEQHMTISDQAVAARGAVLVSLDDPACVAPLLAGNKAATLALWLRQEGFPPTRHYPPHMSHRAGGEQARW